MQYTIDPEVLTDVPLIAQLAGGVIAQWEKSAQDKTFRQRVLQVLKGNRLRLGKVKAVAVTFYTFRGVSPDGVPFETGYAAQVPPNPQSLEVVFDLSVRVATDFDMPVVQVSLPIQRNQI